MNGKDWRPIFKELRRQGWRLELTASGHYKAYPPDSNASIVHLATRSGDPRAIKNALSELCRSGFEYPPKTNVGPLPSLPEPELPFDPDEQLEVSEWDNFEARR